MTNRADWLEERRKGLGGSDSPVILGVSPWRDQVDLYYDKIGEAPEVEETAPMKRGTALEPIIADIYAKETGRRLRVEPEMLRHGCMHANIDRAIDSTPGMHLSPGVLEIKAPGLHQFGKCKREGIPDYYIIQLQHYLAVTGFNWGSFAIFSAERWDLLWFDVDRDEEIISMIRHGCLTFWDHVQSRTPPKVDKEPPEILLKMPKVAGEVTSLEGDAAWAEAVQDLRQAKEISAEAKGMEAAARNNLQALMDKKGLQVAEGSGCRIYYKEQAGRKTFDKKALQRDLPDLDLKKYEKAGKPFKAFRPFFVS